MQFDVEFLDVFQFCVIQCICGCSGLSGIQKFPRGWREVYRVLEVRFEPCPKMKLVSSVWILMIKRGVETLAVTNFNTVLKRLVVWIRSSLLLKIQWLKHHYLSEHGCYSLNMDVILFGSFSHVTIKWIQYHKVDPRAGCSSVRES